jgi:hypothetical protein
VISLSLSKLVSQNLTEAVLVLAAEVSRPGIQSGAGGKKERRISELVWEGFAGLE